MDELTERISELLIRHLQENLTEGEQGELKAWREQSESNEALFQQLTNPDNFENLLADYQLGKKKIWERLIALVPKLAELEEEVTVRAFPLWKYVTAASIILFLSVGSYFLFFYKSSNNKLVSIPDQTLKYKDNDVAPGGNKALLVLNDGKTITLDNAQNGKLTIQGSAEIIKKSDGAIVYSVANNNLNKKVFYNTLKTPITGTYHVTLPDGTEVYLNSISSLHYPTAFVGKERKVEITGEAFFEVARDASRPFRVVINSELSNESTEIEVLGTHFNVMAYNDEEFMKTTLVEGKVRIKKGVAMNSLNPGQQAQINNSIKIINNVNVDKEIAWKNGMFNFDGSDLRTIMRQLARWYDIEVEYSANIPDLRYRGEISRNVNISGVLKALQYVGANFKIEGKRVIVLPN